MSPSPTFVFFGGEPLAVPTLHALQSAGFTPSIVVCNPDRPAGRGRHLTPPPAKTWAAAAGVPVLQPTTYKDGSMIEILAEKRWDLFIVAAYNFILPAPLLNIPKFGTLNIHPSLLPLLRGASPIRSAILQDMPEAVGVSIMLMDEAMDHGPLLAQTPYAFDPDIWPISGPVLDNALATQGAELLVKTIPQWIDQSIIPQPQDHDRATYCSRFQKGENELVLNPTALPSGAEAKASWHKINAFAGIGDTFFMYNGKRVKIKQATLTPDHSLQLLRVIPEGKKEIDFVDFLKQQ